LSSAGCTNVITFDVQVVVTPAPIVTATALPNSICPGTSVTLTSNSNVSSGTPLSLAYNFNSGAGGWTTSNNSAGGTPPNAAWTLRPNNYVTNGLTFNSNDNSQFYLSDSRSQGGGTTRTETYLTSPVFSTVGLTTLSLDFWHYFRYDGGAGTEYARVEVSTNGTVWNNIALGTYTSTQGASGAFVHPTIPLNGYVGNATVWIRFHYYAAGRARYWAIDNVGINGSPSAAASINWVSNPLGFSSVLANPPAVTPAVTTTYTVTYTDLLSNCSGNASATVVVNPIPTILALPAAQTACSGSAITPIVLTNPNSVPGTTYTWTRTANANLSGIALSGSGTPITGTFINSTNTAQSTTFTITAIANGCSSTTTVTVTVNPTPTVTATNTTQTICSATAITNIVITNPNTVTGTIYSWTRDNTVNLTGIAASGSGSPISGTLTNNTNTTQITVFTITATAGGCSSTTTATITVNPKPSVDATPLTQNECSGVAFTPIVITNPNNVAGIIYTWVRTTPVGLAGVPNNGSGTPITGTFTNSTNSPITTTFTITATAGACSSTMTVTVTVNPTPTVNAIAGTPFTYCNGAAAAAINFGSNIAAGVTYAWTSTADVGFGVSGAGNIAAYTATNSGSTPVTSTISVIATANGCSGPARTYTVTVNPTPVATITADYCSVVGHIRLTAHPDPVGYTYLWNTGETTHFIDVDIAGMYSVTVTNTAYGCSASAFLNVAIELVTDGTFTNFVAAAPSFFTQYTQNQAWYTGVATSGLWPEGYYAVNLSAWSNWPNPPQGYHPNFHGRDHTNNAIGARNFMMINGSTTLVGVPPSQRVIWQQTVAVTPNTNYYFSAWGMNLNPANPAQLRFEVNGVQVGSIADLNLAPKPTTEAQVDLSNWVRFYSTPFWNSGAAVTAQIRIINLNTIAGGNDFGLDDISFGTLAPIPSTINPTPNNTVLCEGQTLNLFANLAGGIPPYTFSWTGPNGFTSNLQDPSIPNVTILNSGTYTLTVQDGYGCTPVSQSTIVTIYPKPNATISLPASVCLNAASPVVTFTGSNGTAPYTFVYTINGGANVSVSTTVGNSVTVSIPTNVAGSFTYNLVSVTDAHGCVNSAASSGTITVYSPPVCSINGPAAPLCPSTAGFVFTCPAAAATYLWSISGNGTLPGAVNGSSVTVTSGANCNQSFTLTLTVDEGHGCTSTCTRTVLVQDNTRPTWTTVAGILNRTVLCSDAANLAAAQALVPTATDNCTAILIPVKTAGSFVAGACPQAGTYTNTWTVSDACGNAVLAVYTQTITIIDNVAPIWTTVAGTLNRTFECSNVAGIAGAQLLFPVAADNCDNNVTNIVKVAGAFVPSVGCPQGGTYTNTWTVADDCGNTSAVYTR
jgi:hypothetical protein